MTKYRLNPSQDISAWLTAYVLQFEHDGQWFNVPRHVEVFHLNISNAEECANIRDTSAVHYGFIAPRLDRFKKFIQTYPNIGDYLAAAKDKQRAYEAETVPGPTEPIYLEDLC